MKDRNWDIFVSFFTVSVVLDGYVINVQKKKIHNYKDRFFGFSYLGKKINF